MAASIETATETSILNDIEKNKCENQSENSLATIGANSDEPQQNNSELESVKDSIHLNEMESSLESSNFPIDEIPEPIKVLDDIISEFEEASKPATATNAENQSEDDGYMSLSRKNMRKNDSEEASLTSLNRASVEISNQDFGLKINGEIGSSNENMKHELETKSIDQSLIQTTLPKARVSSTNMIQTNYSSLPCCGARSSGLSGGDICVKQTRTGSCNGDRNVLGIDISAVHKAVLRGGVAKLPEPIVNEHPVTIYPGRYSPPSTDSLRGSNGGNRPQRFISSVEKHKEVCQMLKPTSSKSSSSSSSPRSMSDPSSRKPFEILDLNYKRPNNNKNKGYKINKNDYEESDDEVEDEGDGDDLSEDSIDGEQSSLSMSADLTEKHIISKKLVSVAWEIHFNCDRKRNSKSQSLAKAPHRKLHKNTSYTALSKLKEKTFGIAYSNAIYSLDPEEEFLQNTYELQGCKNYEKEFDYYEHDSNMIGKGTYVIRRNTNSKKYVEDLFQTPSEPYIDGSDLISCISPASEHQYNSSQRGINKNLKQRNSLQGSRDRLTLNIDVHSPNPNSSKMENSQLKTTPYSVVKTQSEDLRFLHQSSKNHSDRKHNSEQKKEQDNIINEYDDIKSFGGYNCSNGSNSIKNSMEKHSTSNSTTPHTDLAPTIEEDEEQYSDLSYNGVLPPPVSASRLKQIEINTGVLPRDVSGSRVGDSSLPKRSLEFRPGVHKSESAKEMLLSQSAGFGPLPPSPPLTISSSKQNLFDYDDFPLPPLPPSPTHGFCEDDDDADDNRNCLPTSPFLLRTTSVEVHITNTTTDEEKKCVSRDRTSERKDKEWDREKQRGTIRQMSDDLPLPPMGVSFEHMPPAVPPHRGHTTSNMKSWSIDSNYRRKSSKVIGGYGGAGGSGITTPTGTHHGAHSNEMLGIVGGVHSAKRHVSYGTKKTSKQSPREEQRGSLQTSCSLPETPIFARGCDIPRTPFRRSNDNPGASGSRTAPRSTTSHNITMGTTLAGVGVNGTSYSGVQSMCRQRSISHALASNEMLRMSGVPARGWYPKQRSMRPASTENIDRLSSMRVWDCAATNIGTSGTSSRKPLTLPPNLTPSFLNKSPREALRRVTSLLITKKKNGKERKNRPYYEDTIDGIMPYNVNTCKNKGLLNKDVKHDSNCNNSALPKASKPPKKKSLFKNFWKRTKHVSLDQ